MPTHNTPAPLLRRAVQSVLWQNYPDFTLVVTNDGGKPPWDALEDIQDPRLVRYDAPANRGRYHADAAVLAACRTEWFTPHDSDDWSEPNRLELLLAAASDAAVSPARFHGRDGSTHVERPKPDRVGQLTTVSRYTAGLYRTDALRDVGIPCHVRGSADTAVVSLFWIAHDIATVEQPLYHIVKRDGSLTTSHATGLHSSWRREQRRLRKDAFRRAVDLQPPERAAAMGYCPDPDQVAEIKALLG